MKIKFFYLLIVFNTLNCWYQDIVINGKIVEKGERNCLPTYNILKMVLDKYQRPFSVLDVGAAQGFFSLMIAKEYDATCVMVEGDYDYANHSDKLLELCHANTDLNNIILLKKVVDLDFLENLSECEHFDVTLALNFVHHSGLDWKKTIDFLVEMGDNLILENPPSDEISMPEEDNQRRKQIDLYINQLGAVVIGEVERHNPSLSKSKIWWLHKPKTFLKRRHIFWPPPTYVNYIENGKRHFINSDFKIKELVKKLDKEEIRSNWVNGINLVTFLAYNGIYPSKECLIKEISKLKSEQIADWGIANMIVAGNKLTLIDKVDFIFQKAYQILINFIASGKSLDSSMYWCINQNRSILNKHNTPFYVKNNRRSFHLHPKQPSTTT